MKTQHSNKLIHENSPYLLQHAYNPVNWMPWGDEALQKAKNENKLILVSIGYSACHWCHVMEKESFEDEAVAKIMNDRFVCIKVDREEHPDVDTIYMEAVQMITRQGGWPLNCFALPDGRPVYGGTYFPKSQWTNLCLEIDKIFKNEPKQIYRQATAIEQELTETELKIGYKNQNAVTTKEIQASFTALKNQFDKNNGGFMGAPKFPLPVIWNAILSYAQHFNDHDALEQVERTLIKIARGGIYDQIGGGFSRYSVDTRWFVPHFEKMLYDNAQLISLYARMYKITSNQEFRSTIDQSLAFIQRELTHENGSFFSSLDADSDNEEGKFYTWNTNEFNLLDEKIKKNMIEYFGLTKEGNWEKGKNILHREFSPELYAERNNLNKEEWPKDLKAAKEKLLNHRSKRNRPALDYKIIASWNALMITALVNASEATQNEQYKTMALNAGLSLEKNLINNDFSMLRTSRNNEKTIDACFDDYSYTIEAFINLYQLTFDENWLIKAKKLTLYSIHHFFDEKSKLFNYTSALSKVIVVRKKEILDQVTPSSNSVMAMNLIKLAAFFSRPEFEKMAKKMLQTISSDMLKHIRFYSNWAKVYLNTITPMIQIVVSGPKASNYMIALKNAAPLNSIFAGATKYSKLPIFKNRMDQEQTKIYICINKTCKLPVTSVKEAILLFP